MKSYASERTADKPKSLCLDIGLNTLDLYCVLDGKVLPRFIGGAKVGVMRLLEFLDGNGHDPEELDAQLRTGRLKPSKDQLDSWLSEIMASVERTWPSLRRFTTVISAGGGSVLLGDAIAHGIDRERCGSHLA